MTLFFNARDGLRGRYWQSCEHGVGANCDIIDRFTPFLLSAFEQAPDGAKTARRVQPLTLDHAALSLRAASAKIWPAETDLGGVREPGYPAIEVRRWRQNQPTENYDRWRWSPEGNEIEIKGALVDPDGFEHVPDGKRDRAFQIHKLGIT